MRRRRFSDRPGLHTLSELNVTPLLDLAFVLLIIFMITTPLMETSTDLVLPKSDGSPGAEQSERAQVVSVRADGQVFLNQEAMELAAVEAQLTALRSTDPELAVIIRSHHEQKVQRFSDVLDAVRRAGVTRIGFASTPKD